MFDKHVCLPEIKGGPDPKQGFCDLWTLTRRMGVRRMVLNGYHQHVPGLQTMSYPFASGGAVHQTDPKYVHPTGRAGSAWLLPSRGQTKLGVLETKPTQFK